MRPASQPRRAFAFLAAIALVLAAVTASFQRAPAQTAGLVDPVLGLVSVCTADASPATPEQGGGRHQHSQYHCPLCTLLTPVALPDADLPDTAVVFAATPLPAPVPQEARTLADHLVLGGIRSRAPPLRA